VRHRITLGDNAPKDLSKTFCLMGILFEQG
jgi:hypothetical protein